MGISHQLVQALDQLLSTQVPASHLSAWRYAARFGNALFFEAVVVVLQVAATHRAKKKAEKGGRRDKAAEGVGDEKSKNVGKMGHRHQIKGRRGGTESRKRGEGAEITSSSSSSSCLVSSPVVSLQLLPPPPFPSPPPPAAVIWRLLRTALPPLVCLPPPTLPSCAPAPRSSSALCGHLTGDGSTGFEVARCSSARPDDKNEDEEEDEDDEEEEEEEDEDDDDDDDDCFPPADVEWPVAAAAVDTRPE